MAKNISLIGIAVLLLGVVLLKVNDILGYSVAAIGCIAGFIGIVLNDKENKQAKKAMKDSQRDLSKQSYESDGKVLIFDRSTPLSMTQLWFDLNKNCLIKTFAVLEVRDFIPHDYEYKLPDKFLENYTIDDLHYFITQNVMSDLDYRNFIQYNALLICKFKNPFSNGQPLKIIKDMKMEAEKQKQKTLQREKERLYYNEFISKTKHIFFCNKPVYGQRGESVRQDKTTGEYYYVVEIPTGRGTGFLTSEPEMTFESDPKRITADEVKALKSCVESQANDEGREYQALQAFHRGGMDREQAFAIYKSHKDPK